MADQPDELLVAELRDLGDWLAVPPAPDLRGAVRARLTAAPAVAPPSRTGGARGWRSPLALVAQRRWPRRWRRWLAAAVALVVGTILAVPPARIAVADAITGLFRFAGVEVRQGSGPPPSLPATPSPLPAIRSASLDEARRVARFPVKVPTSLGTPEDVVVADPTPDGAPRVVTLTYRGGTVRLDQFDGRLDMSFVKQAQNVAWTQVAGAPALWFPGPHTVTYRDRNGFDRVATARLAAPTLIWEMGGVTYRLEGPATVAEAVTIAESLR